MTSIGCVSVTGCRASISLLEQLNYPVQELTTRLPELRRRSRADQLAVLSTCERTELYAVWPGKPDHDSLVRALAADRAVPFEVVDPAARRFTDDGAVRHLFRVATGLESFVIGDTDVTGQVRTAAEISRSTASDGLELERLMMSAVSTSRRARRETSFTESSRSVGTAAVDTVAAMYDGDLTGCRLLVVGAGQVATAVVPKAVALGATVTVCNRSRRGTDRFIAQGARVVDLVALSDCLATTDVVIVSTAAPHPLIDQAMVESARRPDGADLLILDLCLPRNVDESVRGVSGTRLLDLEDLRSLGPAGAAVLTDDLATAARTVEDEVGRFTGWLAARSAAEAVRRLREDSERITRDELERLRRGSSAEVYAVVEQAVGRVVRRLVHGPTQEVLAAAQAGDQELVRVLAGMFGSAPVTLEPVSPTMPAAVRGPGSGRSTGPEPARAARSGPGR